MDLHDRIKTILAENDLKQKDLAEIVGVKPSFISMLVNKRSAAVSQSFGNLIEEKLGYYSEWVIDGTGPKMKHLSKNLKLSAEYQKAITLMEQMSEAQVRCVLSFIDYLHEVETELNCGDKHRSEE